jgi:Cytochrome C and Quinol oxidase polypeptide I
MLEVDMLGRLSWDAIPFNEPLPIISMAVVLIVILAVLALVTVKGWWPYLWREWLTSVDHKRIGVMYVTLGLVMLLRGFSDAIMMRTQQAIAVGDAQGYLPPDHYDQIFSAHGTIMIFFVAMPLVIGLMNFAVPLQLGVRDVAFPVLNSVSFWLTATGALLINSVACHWQFRAHRLDGLPAALRARLFARCRCRLLPLVIADLGRRHVADRHQFRDHDSQIARSGHDLLPHAGVLLDRARRKSADRRRVPGPYRSRACAARGTEAGTRRGAWYTSDKRWSQAW